MDKDFSKNWISSKQPRKQRKYRHNAPLNVRSSFMNVHLSKELIKKHGRRSMRLRKGDKVTVLRGQFRKSSGKVEKIDLKSSKAYVAGVETIKKDGTKAPYPISPSNLIITELKLDDKKRAEAMQRKPGKPKED